MLKYEYRNYKMQSLVREMAEKKVCNIDCFNCEYEDCINDKLEIEDYLAGEKIDRDIIRDRSQKRKRKLSKLAIKRKKEYKDNNPENSRAYARAYYSVNRERYRKYRLENRDRKSAYDRKYSQENKDKIAERKKIYGEKNKQHLRERQKEWREKNREKIREYQREYYLRKKMENEKREG